MKLSPRLDSKAVITAAKWLLTIATLAFLAEFVLRNAHQLPALADTWRSRGDQGWTLLVLAGCYLMSWLAVAAQFQIPLRRRNPAIRFRDNAALIISGALLNYSPFKAGTIYRFYFLKKRFGISYGALAGLQVARMVVTVGLAGLVGICALGYWYQLTGEWDALFFPAYLMMVVLGVTPFLLKPALLQGHRGRYAGFLRELLNGAGELRRDLPAAAAMLLLIGCQFAILVIQYGVIFHLLGLVPPILVYLLLIPLITILGMISITPGNLGLREILVASALSVAGQSFDAGVFAGLLDRGVLLASTLVFGGLALAYLALGPGRGPAVHGGSGGSSPLDPGS